LHWELNQAGDLVPRAQLVQVAVADELGRVSGPVGARASKTIALSRKDREMATMTAETEALSLARAAMREAPELSPGAAIAPVFRSRPDLYGRYREDRTLARDGLTLAESQPSWPPVRPTRPTLTPVLPVSSAPAKGEQPAARHEIERRIAEEIAARNCT